MPIIAVGMNAIKMRLIISKSRIIVRLYKKITDRIAPDCMDISNVLTNSVCSIASKFEVKIKCPVEEIGRNSVIPSMIPKMIA